MSAARDLAQMQRQVRSQMQMQPTPAPRRRKTRTKQSSAKPAKRSRSKNAAAGQRISKSSAAKKDRSVLRQMAAALAFGKSKSSAGATVPAIPSSGGPASTESSTEAGSAPARGMFMKVFGVIALLALTIFVGLYFDANPKTCTKRQCSTVTKLPENALAIVAANISSNCSAKEKSKRVREIIENTLEEIEY